MKQFVPVLLVLAAASLSGCAALQQRPAAPQAPAAQPAPVAPATPRLAPSGAKTADRLDQTTAAEKAAALAAPASGRELGKVTVSLGSPTEQGFWLRSALSKEKAPGVVRLASGKTVQVDLMPLAGGGPQMSLAAYRALGLGLTDLPQVTVLAR